jgi:hypothetical protein
MYWVVWEWIQQISQYKIIDSLEICKEIVKVQTWLFTVRRVDLWEWYEGLS